jgi:hypothetical protein
MRESLFVKDVARGCYLEGACEQFQSILGLKSAGSGADAV